VQKSSDFGRRSASSAAITAFEEIKGFDARRGKYEFSRRPYTCRKALI